MKLGHHYPSRIVEVVLFGIGPELIGYLLQVLHTLAVAVGTGPKIHRRHLYIIFLRPCKVNQAQSGREYRYSKY